MARRSSVKALLAVVALLAICAGAFQAYRVCARRAADRAKREALRKALLPSPSYVPPLPSAAGDPDYAAAIEMRSALDAGDYADALARARALMDSTNTAVRAQVLTVFGWVGGKALAELTEMLSDPDETISLDALSEWERVCDSLRFDEDRVLWATNALTRVSERGKMDVVLMRLASVEKKLSLPALEGVILSNEGNAAGACAKEMFEHIAGEPWSSPSRTQSIVSTPED